MTRFASRQFNSFELCTGRPTIAEMRWSLACRELSARSRFPSRRNLALQSVCKILICPGVIR